MAGFFNNISALFSRNNGQLKAPIHNNPDTSNTDQKATICVDDDAFYQRLLPASKSMLPLTVPQKLIIQVVEKHLANEEGRNLAVPRLPNIIPQLIRSLKDPKASSKDYAQVIRKDPSMTAGVLKYSNSVYFNPAGNTITSIDVAVVTLGIDGLRSVLSTAVMQPVIQQKTPYFNQFGQRLWQHSLATAIICELLAKARGIDLYKAYLLGLTHNIGKITIFSEICQQLKTLQSEGSPDRSAFVPLLKERSDLLTYKIAKDWQLPDEIISALKQQASLTNQTNLGPFSALLDQAKNISKNYLAYKYSGQEKLSSQLLKQNQLPENLFDLLDET